MRTRETKNVQMRQKRAKIHKKNQNTYKIRTATPKKHKKTNLQENNANFYTYLNQERIQQMNLCN